MRYWFFGLIIACGCASAPPQEAAPAAASTNDRCFEDCVHDNQMRAVSIQMIENDCRDRCAAEQQATQK